jgi:peroxiredoxin Q/BCP
MSSVLAPGTAAPNFTLPDQDGQPVTLRKLRGAPVVVYFYPKAGTPGCTAQACGVRDHRAEYERAGVTVLGISRDSVAALKAFAKEHRLTTGPGYRLLSDEDHATAETYGVWVEKSMYGRTHMGMQRSTFIVDAKGKLAHVIPKANPRKHDEVVLEALGVAVG